MQSEIKFCIFYKYWSFKESPIKFAYLEIWHVWKSYEIPINPAILQRNDLQSMLLEATVVFLATIALAQRLLSCRPPVHLLPLALISKGVIVIQRVVETSRRST